MSLLLLSPAWKVTLDTLYVKRYTPSCVTVRERRSEVNKTFRALLWILVITALATAACSDLDSDERRGERSEGQPPAVSPPAAPSSGMQPVPAPGATGR